MARQILAIGSGLVLLLAAFGVCWYYFNENPPIDVLVDRAIARIQIDADAAAIAASLAEREELSQCLLRRAQFRAAERKYLLQLLTYLGQFDEASRLLPVADHYVAMRRELSDAEVADLATYLSTVRTAGPIERLVAIADDEHCSKTSRMLALRMLGLRCQSEIDPHERSQTVAALDKYLSPVDCDLYLNALVAQFHAATAIGPEHSEKIGAFLSDCTDHADDQRVEYLRYLLESK